MQTDAGGNVPGWMNEGTYKIVAAASGGFGGGTINFDALYGGGTAQIAIGAVGTSQIQAGAVGSTQLATAVANSLVPAGVILDFAGSTPPSGFLSCNGSIVSQSSYPNLYSAIGATWNSGGEGTGNFRLPNATNRFHLGSGGTLVVGGSGGALGHTHASGSLSFGVNVNTNVGSEWVTGSIPALTVNGASFVAGSYAAIGFAADGTSWFVAMPNNIGGFPTGYDFVIGTNGGFINGGKAMIFPELEGGTNATSTVQTPFGDGWIATTGGTYAGSGNTATASGVTAAADPPYIVVAKIIKY